MPRHGSSRESDDNLKCSGSSIELLGERVDRGTACRGCARPAGPPPPVRPLVAPGGQRACVPALILGGRPMSRVLTPSFTAKQSACVGNAATVCSTSILPPGA